MRLGAGVLVVVVAAVAMAVFDLGGVAPRVSAAARSSLGLAVTRVQPAVASPDSPVTVQVAVSNSGDALVSDVLVRARLGQAPLSTRTAVRDFGAGRTSPRTAVVAETSLPAVAAGAIASTTLTLDPEQMPAVRAYGVLPLVIEAEAGASTVRQRTYLPVHTRKEYEPLRLAFALPLTLDPDPALVTATGEQLDQAWTRMAGPGSRIDRILTATAGRPVTLALDPTLVGYSDERDDPPPSVEGDRQAPATSAIISDITDSIAERLRTDTERSVWELPPGDPDLAALSAPDVDHRLLDSIAGLATDLPALLGLPAGAAAAAIPRIAWPAAEPLDDSRRVVVDAAFTRRGADRPAAYVTSSASVATDPEITGTAARRTPGGSPLLVTDDALGTVLAGTTRGLDAGADTQLFLAESLTLLAESPGRERTVLVTAPRSFAPDVSALAALLDSAVAAPWIDVVSTDTLRSAASAPGAPVARPRIPSPDGSTGPAPTSPLNAREIERLISTGQHIAGISSVLAPTDTSRRIPRAGTIQALASARWRSQTAAYDATSKAVHERFESLTTGVTVLPSTVNFLAEHGILQVTVVNNLDVAVQNVRLVLEPQGRPPRLRVTDPAPLSIAPGSRTTVRVSVDAVAAGVVPVSTYLTTATGTRLGTDATVNVRVQPTGGWVVTVGGVLVGLTFVIGLYRTFKRGRPRVTEAELEGIDLE